MHGGPLIALRQSLESARYWRPWQQAILAAALLVGGIALCVLLGMWIGVAIAAIGALLVKPAVRGFLHVRRSGRAQAARSPSSDPPEVSDSHRL